MTNNDRFGPPEQASRDSFPGCLKDKPSNIRYPLNSRRTILSTPWCKYVALEHLKAKTGITLSSLEAILTSSGQMFFHRNTLPFTTLQSLSKFLWRPTSWGWKGGSYGYKSSNGSKEPNKHHGRAAKKMLVTLSVCVFVCVCVSLDPAHCLQIIVLYVILCHLMLTGLDKEPTSQKSPLYGWQGGHCHILKGDQNPNPRIWKYLKIVSIPQRGYLQFKDGEFPKLIAYCRHPPSLGNFAPDLVWTHQTLRRSWMMRRSKQSDSNGSHLRFQIRDKLRGCCIPHRGLCRFIVLDSESIHSSDTAMATHRPLRKVIWKFKHSLTINTQTCDSSQHG